MSAEEQHRISGLSAAAIQEYEGLQRKHDKATMECRRLEEERDTAVKRLNEFQQVSKMVIEEVAAIQENLELERTCRESAEALASKLSLRNRSLKRKSMMLLSQLGPQAATRIGLEDEEEEEEEEEEGGEEVCLSPQCQTRISELQNMLELMLQEKNQAAADLKLVTEQLSDTREELLKEKHQNIVLTAENLKQKKLLGKYNRVSQMAVEEYEVLQDTLNLEQDLRAEAESFARAMLVEQKTLKRQSQILMRGSSLSPALQEALNQVSSLTRDLETQRLESQDQIKQLEDKLSSCQPQKELAALRCKLELVEEEKQESEVEVSKARAEVKDLRFTVEELQKRLREATNPPPAAAPPPPPPPLPPPTSVTSSPLSSLLTLIRKRRDVTADIQLVDQDSKTAEPDARRRALDEMMQRIKRGVQLRPVGLSADRSGRTVKKPPSDVAIQELKGILGNFNKTPPRPKAAPPPPTPDAELRRILLRRRDAAEPPPDAAESRLYV